MDDRVQIGGLGVAGSLHRFVTEEALPGSGIEADAFWAGLDALVHDLAPRNRELLARRDELQARAAPTPRPTPRSSPRSATCSTSRTTSRSAPTTSTTRSRTSPGRSWSCRC
jgi:malate synthase